MIRPYTSLDIQEAFAPTGFISRSLTGFEVRPQQVEMASAIQRALHTILLAAKKDIADM